MRSVLTLMMAAVLLIASLFLGRPMTPIGIHCPTAAVQLVDDGFGLRAPTQGEKEFRQCCCRERQSSQTAQAALLSSLPPFIFQLADLNLRQPVIGNGSHSPDGSAVLPRDVEDAPLLPPPDSV